MNEPFYVGPWLVTPEINRIGEGASESRVEPKVMAVLVALSRNPGQVVSRQQLFDEVWGGTVVTDDVLTRSVSELRKAFGDDRRRPRYIETIPTTGYRLVAPVSTMAEGPQGFVDSAPESSGRARLDRASGGRIAVFSLTAVVLAAAVVVVWTMVSDGGNGASPLYPTPVTTYPGRESPPRLSPDGRQVAFSWGGEDGGNVDLYVKYVDAAPVLRLTNDSTPNTDPAWSPDGTEIAFVNWRDGCWIRIVSAIGGAPRTLGSCGQSVYGDLTWSPDGRWLAFNDRSQDTESFAIHLMSPASGETRRLTHPPSGIWGDHDPAFSPDGERIAFVRSVSEGQQDVYVTSLEAGEDRRLTFENRNVWGLDWTDDGGDVVFASNRTGRFALWAVDYEDGALRWLGVQSPAATFPSIRNGRLAFMQVETDVNLWRVSLATVGEAATFSPSTYWDLHPAISPDGAQVAFASNRSGSYEIWVADSSGGSLRQLTDFGGPFTSTPRWSPDGSRLLFTGRPDGHADLFYVDLSGQRPTRITTDPADDLAGDWLSDGRSLIFTSNRSGSWETWRTDLAGSVPEQLTHSGSFGPRLLAGDGQIAFSRPTESGIWSLSIRSGREEELVPLTDPRDWGSWSFAGNVLYYLRRGSPNRIERLDLATGVTDTVYETKSWVPAMDPSLAISPDQRWLLVGQVDREETDIMVVDLRFEN